MRLDVQFWRRARGAAAVAPLLFGIVVGGGIGVGRGYASEVQIWRADSQAAFLAAELVDVSVDRLGILRLAQRAERFAAVAEPFLFTLVGAEGRYVAGTGNSGKVLEIAVDGDAASVADLFATEEPEVFAVWVADDGTVYAGSSPDGKVYRRSLEGEVQAVFDPEAKYIWALLGTPDGGLLVATGVEGKLFRLDLASGESRLLHDSADVHVRSLALRGDGTVLAGTAGEGLLLEIDPEGGVRALHDAAGPEVLAITPGEDGVFYAAALASEASLVDLSSLRSASNGDSSESRTTGNGSGGEDESASANGQRSEVKVQTGAVAAGSRSASFQGPRSEVLRIDPSGAVESIWKFEMETVYALSHQQGRLWAATGQEGKLFSFQGDRMVLEKDLDQSQIVGLAPGAAGPVFASVNGAAVYGFVGDGGGQARSGTVTAKPLDASSVASFGSIRWHGRGGNGAVALSARSGMSSAPDETWSAWTEASPMREAPLAELPPGRYLQWRAELRGDRETTPEVVAVEVTYRQHNRKPEIKKLEVLPAGTILTPANFNPANQAYEPAHPNRDRIFTTVGDPAQTKQGATKRLWKLGYRTLRWEAEDPNQDRLRYRLSFAREEELAARGGDGGADGSTAADAPWLLMADDLKAAFFSFDATVLPDGVYRFRLAATDQLDNASGGALEAEEVSAAVVIDHSPARMVQASRTGGKVTVVVEDAWSSLREAVVSTDAGAWRAAGVEDGLLDSRRETLSIDAAEDARLLLLRLTDTAHNVTTVDLSGQLGDAR